MDTKTTIIGLVRSPFTQKRDCPKQYTEGAPPATIELDPAYAPAMLGLEPGQDILVFTWLDRADRSRLQVHPRGDANLPMRGVFATRSPDRPTPIGLHMARITAIAGTTMEVDAMEVLDKTPVLDIKSVGPEHPAGENWGSAVPAGMGREIRELCAQARNAGLLSGFSGNASLRAGNLMVITRTGTATGFVAPETLTALDLDTGRVLGPGAPSSEFRMHLEIYKARPEAKAVLHTHPPHLLALGLSKWGPRLDLPLFEAKVLQKELAVVPAMEPGTDELARAVGQAAESARAIFMQHHGLTCWAEDAGRTLAMSEELENLARIRLLAGDEAF